MKQGNTKYQMSLAKCARKLEHYMPNYTHMVGQLFTKRSNWLSFDTFFEMSIYLSCFRALQN